MNVTEELLDEQTDTLPEIAEEQPQEKLSLREEISKARDNIKEDKGEKTEKTGRERDEAGKFAKSEKPVKKQEVSHVSKENQSLDEKPEIEVKKEPEIQVPQGLNAAIKAKWKELPADIRQEFARREQDFHKELTRHDEERQFGRQIEKIVTPYMAQIRAEGATAPQAIESLLNVAHLLRVGTPQQKSELLLRTAQSYGVDLRQEMQQVQQPQNPQLQQAMQKVQELESRLTQAENLKKQQEENGIQEQIKAFAEDPEHIHFETVKAHMASLLKSGLAQDLKDAYDQAVYANPNTRSTLLQQQTKTVQEKRVAEQKARADAARKAGSSIKGAPGMAANKNGKIVQPDLRSELRAAFATHIEG